jgi:hypothetical protein
VLNLPWLTRRVLLGAAAVVLAVALVVTMVQVRAAQAEERREVAAQATADAEREAAAEAEAERRAAEDAALEADWEDAVADAEARLAAAEETLAGSHGRVADETPRVALTEAMAEVRALVDEGVSADAPATLRAAAAALTPAIDAVTQAAQSWQAAEDARLAAEAQARAEAEAEAEAAAAAERRTSTPALGGPPSTGAGPDCGGPESYEPPKNDGPVFYTSTPSSSGDGSNGRIPADRMTPLGWCQDSQGNKQWLRSDAAAALTRLNEAFRAQFGENIAVDLSYRSYETQVAMREAYGSLAARPGTSNHGTGVAIDTWEWKAYAFGSARYDWLVANGPAYGWVAPDWARQGGSNPEYWHFEYVG